MEVVMCDSLVQIYLHFIWGTWDRLPLITENNEQQIYKAILEKCTSLYSSVIAIGGMPDHLHLLTRFPAIITVADYIKAVKGSTSHLMTQSINAGEFFKWQGGYAVYSVSVRDVSKIKKYIQYQKEHHTNNKLYSELEL